MNQNRTWNRRLVVSLASPEALILAVLSLTLILSGTLAVHAHRAADSHRKAAEGALRDYATFATWELDRRLSHSLGGALRNALMRAQVRLLSGPESREDQDENMALYEASVHEELMWFGAGRVATKFFWMDPETGVPELPDLTPALRSALAEVLQGEFPEDASAPQIVLRGTSNGGEGARRMVRPISAPIFVRSYDAYSSRMVLTHIRGTAGTRGTVYGFVLDVAGLARPITRAAIESDPLLPASLTGGASVEEVLALRIRTSAGEMIYESGGMLPPQTRVADTLHSDIATLVTEIGVRPEMARSLVIGGLPPSRMPLLLSLFVVTLGLAAIAVMQLRRQRMLVRMRSDFISGVSHELRTPLAQIQLFAELLETRRLRRDQRERSIRIIREESRRLTYLVENIMRFSGSERNATRVETEPAVMAPFIREVVESFAPLARARGTSLTMDLEEDVLAAIDRRALRQVLLNLLDNAVKYGPSCQRVAVGLTAAGDDVILSVSDEGPGVPPADRERIWQPYVRLEHDADSAVGGSGIGLSVVRELVEMHGGRVSVRERGGGGSVFELRLPRAEIRPGDLATRTTTEATG